MDLIHLHVKFHSARLTGARSSRFFVFFHTNQLHRSDLTHKITKLRKDLIHLHVKFHRAHLTGARSISFLEKIGMGSAW